MFVGVLRVLAMVPEAISAASLFTMMSITVVDVVGRYGFNSPLAGAYEINALGLGVVVFGALPAATVNREHVTVDLVSTLFRGGAEIVRNLQVQIVSMLALGWLSWQLFVLAGQFAGQGDFSSYLHVPLAPIVYFMAAMAGLAALGVLARLGLKNSRGTP